MQTDDKCDGCKKHGNIFRCRQCSRFYHDLYDGDTWTPTEHRLPDHTEAVRAHVVRPKTGREYFVARAFYLGKHQVTAIKTDSNGSYIEVNPSDGLYYYRPGWYERLMVGDNAYMPIPDQVIEWKLAKGGI